MNKLADISLGKLSGYGPLGENVGNGVSVFSNFLSSAIGLLTIIAGIWFIFTFFIGAIGIITAGSDKQALENSRKKIVTGIIGLVVTISAIFVVKLIGTIFGIDFLNIAGLLGKL